MRVALAEQLCAKAMEGCTGSWWSWGLEEQCRALALLQPKGCDFQSVKQEGRWLFPYMQAWHLCWCPRSTDCFEQRFIWRLEPSKWIGREATLLTGIQDVQSINGHWRFTSLRSYREQATRTGWHLTYAQTRLPSHSGLPPTSMETTLQFITPSVLGTTLINVDDERIVVLGKHGQDSAAQRWKCSLHVKAYTSQSMSKK